MKHANLLKLIGSLKKEVVLKVVHVPKYRLLSFEARKLKSEKEEGTRVGDKPATRRVSLLGSRNPDQERGSRVRHPGLRRGVGPLNESMSQDLWGSITGKMTGVSWICRRGRPPDLGFGSLGLWVVTLLSGGRTRDLVKGSAVRKH